MAYLVRRLEKYRTEILGALAAVIMICTGLILPNYLPDQFPNAPPGFEDATWVKMIITVLLVGMGILSFTWLVVIQRIITRGSKKDYMY
ncbi:MAG: hypothetical protein ACXAC8_10015 [Candidatus Hodarchaeales archaeon]|jgi:hypothetical protein